MQRPCGLVTFKSQLSVNHMLQNWLQMSITSSVCFSVVKFESNVGVDKKVDNVSACAVEITIKNAASVFSGQCHPFFKGMSVAV